MRSDILISGFGGQGLMSLGRLLARAALEENKYTTWFPSYGAEMRGGTAHCFVKVSSEPIASPFIDTPDIAIILNQPSLAKFKDKFKKDTLVVLNSDLINDDDIKPNIRKISMPLNKIALECGNIRVANIIALGLICFLTPEFLKEDTIIKILKNTFRDKEILKQNLSAFNRGKELCVYKGRNKCLE